MFASRFSLCLKVLALALIAPLAAHADEAVLEEAFYALPPEARIEVQQELSRADLFLGEVNGRWSASTERALMRGVETVALNSNGMERYDMESAAGIRQFLSDLRAGKFNYLLKTGSDTGGLLSDHPKFR